MEADVRTIQAGNDCLPPHCSLISLKSRPAAMAEECDLSLWQVSMYSGRLGGSFPESASGRSWPLCIAFHNGQVRSFLTSALYVFQRQEFVT